MWKMGALTAAHLTPRLYRIYKPLQCVKDNKITWANWLVHVLRGALVACSNIDFTIFYNILVYLSCALTGGAQWSLRRTLFLLVCPDAASGLRATLACLVSVAVIYKCD